MVFEMFFVNKLLKFSRFALRVLKNDKKGSKKTKHTPLGYYKYKMKKTLPPSLSSAAASYSRSECFMAQTAPLHRSQRLLLHIRKSECFMAQTAPLHRSQRLLLHIRESECFSPSAAFLKVRQEKCDDSLKVRQEKCDDSPNVRQEKCKNPFKIC